jgi:hypothetical protein
MVTPRDILDGRDVVPHADTPPEPAEKPKKTRNPELRAMEQIHAIVSKFDANAGFRIVNWVVDTLSDRRVKENKVSEVSVPFSINHVDLA